MTTTCTEAADEPLFHAYPRHRGLPKINWQFTFAMAAYNLVRLPKLLGAAA